MLKLALISATILISVTAAQAQYKGAGDPFDTLFAPFGYDDQQKMRRDHGLDYDHSIDRPSSYQPYPTVTPHYDPYHPRTNNGTSYGDDD